MPSGTNGLAKAPTMSIMRYMIDNETGPWAIGRLCREQGRQKRWVAEQLGISPARLSRLIAGDITLRLQEAALLAEIFGVPIETFVPRPPGAGGVLTGRPV